MICGEQISYGMPVFCGERKADGLYLCRGHWDELIADGDSIAFAEGNAWGEPHIRVRLLWEPWEGDDPVEATPEEIALYASILDPARD
jgi:hypothetical protein